MISYEQFLLLYNEYSSKNPEFEPLKLSTCAVAVMLQKYFRLGSVVPGTSGAFKDPY